MRVFSKKQLRRFWKRHADAKIALLAWHRVALAADWNSFADVRRDSAAVDRHGKFYIFNIKGNKYRLIVTMNLDYRIVYLRHFLTHAEYDKGLWKKD